MMERETSRAWAEISRSALEHNYRAIRSHLPAGCRFLGIVKADAYGHGAVRVSRALSDFGCDMLAVACLAEGEELRAAGIDLPILILGPTLPQLAERVVAAGLTQAVGEPVLARALSDAAGRLGRPALVHVKLDTGMSRSGILARQADRAADEAAAICALPHLEVGGVFTHFAAADADEDYTMTQFTRFLEALDAAERRHHLTFPIRHCAASSAVLNYPCTHLDMVRPGIALYGHYPAPSCRDNSPVELEPVMSLYARVAAVRHVPAGTPIGYGCTHVVDRDSRIATLSIGYADGLLRTLSDRLTVGLAGGRAPVLGLLCMDMCMADVTDLDGVSVGDAACIFGPSVPLEEVSALAGTIHYELLCAVAPRVERVWLP